MSLVEAVRVETEMRKLHQMAKNHWEAQRRAVNVSTPVRSGTYCILMNSSVYCILMFCRSTPSLQHRAHVHNPVGGKRVYNVVVEQVFH